MTRRVLSMALRGVVLSCALLSAAGLLPEGAYMGPCFFRGRGWEIECLQIKDNVVEMHFGFFGNTLCTDKVYLASQSMYLQAEVAGAPNNVSVKDTPCVRMVGGDDGASQFLTDYCSCGGTFEAGRTNCWDYGACSPSNPCAFAPHKGDHNGPYLTQVLTTTASGTITMEDGTVFSKLTANVSCPNWVAMADPAATLRCPSPRGCPSPAAAARVPHALSNLAVSLALWGAVFAATGM